MASTGLAGCQGDAPWFEPNERGGNLTRGRGAVVGDKFKGETIQLGLLTPDGNSVFGTGFINGMDLAVREINESGGILGADVEYHVGKTKLSASRAKNVYQDFTINKGVSATFGVLLLLRPLLPLIAEERTLHFTTGSPDAFPAELVSKAVSPINGNPEEEYEKYKYHFRYGPPSIPKIIEFLIEMINLNREKQGWEKIAILIANISLLEGIPQRIKQGLPGSVDVPIAKQVSEGIADWTPVFDDLEQNDVDLALVGFALAGAVPVKQWADQQRPFEMGGAVVKAMATGFWDQTNGACEGLWTGNAITPQSTNTPVTQKFAKAYQSRYGGLPAPSGPLTYDAVKLYADAVREVGTTNPEDLIPYLEKMEWNSGLLMDNFRFNGPQKRFAHDPLLHCMSEKTCGDKAAGVPLFSQWQRGESGGGVQQVFAPEMNKTGEYQKPPWMR